VKGVVVHENSLVALQGGTESNGWDKMGPSGLSVQPPVVSSCSGGIRPPLPPRQSANPSKITARKENTGK
jgi:hypothetical protein